MHGHNRICNNSHLSTKVVEVIPLKNFYKKLIKRDYPKKIKIKVLSYTTLLKTGVLY